MPDLPCAHGFPAFHLHGLALACPAHAVVRLYGMVGMVRHGVCFFMLYDSVACWAATLSSTGVMFMIVRFFTSSRVHAHTAIQRA